jgi:translation initiation factor 5A
MVEKVFAIGKELREGKYVIIDDIPCRIVQIESSKPGKHGAAKMRVTGIGIFDGQKKTLLTPSDADVEVPIIERKDALILSVSGNVAQVMDKSTNETYDIDVPEDLLPLAASGKDAEVLEALGRRKMERIK